MMNEGEPPDHEFDTEEQTRPSTVEHDDMGRDIPLLARCGWWGLDYVWVLDLQTGEGAYFRHGGNAKADLTKHAIWVCPLYEPFLTWLYAQDLSDIEALPARIDLPNSPFSFAGYRRPGPTAAKTKKSTGT